MAPPRLSLAKRKLTPIGPVSNASKSQSTASYDVAVLGAGPAGLFCIASILDALKESPARIVLIEHGSTMGRKLLVTGGGACNLTNAEPITQFKQRYGKAGKTIAPVLSAFDNRALMYYFERNGLPLKVDERKKVFPRSRRAGDVLSVLKKRCANPAVSLRMGCSITRIEQRAEGGYILTDAQKNTIACDAIVVATGGISYPTTGSDGSIWPVLEPLLQQHDIPMPKLAHALVPLTPEEYPFASLEGIAFADAEITTTATTGSKPKRVTKQGELLLTRTSFSGPLALDMSKYVDLGGQFIVNFVPSFNPESLFDALVANAARSRKSPANSLAEVLTLPHRLLDYAATAAKLGDDIRNVSHKQWRLVATMIAGGRYVRCARESRQGMVTAGGYALSELNLSSMESKKLQHLYVIGEAVDVDGDTGGYNLQWAFSSAYVCGQALAKLISQ